MIGAIELEILKRIRDCELDFGYKYSTLETYPSDWDKLIAEKGQVNSPALWTGFARATKVERGGMELIVTGTFGLTVLSKHVNNEQARRHGGNGVTGSYQLVFDAMAALDGFTPASACSSITVGEPVTLAGLQKEMKASMIAVPLSIKFAVPILPDVDSVDLAAFERFHANWDIPRFGNVDANSAQPGIQLPDDTRADATDHLELEQ